MSSVPVPGRSPGAGPGDHPTPAPGLALAPPAQASVWALTRAHLRTSISTFVVWVLVVLLQVLIPIVVTVVVDDSETTGVTLADSALFTWSIVLLVVSILVAGSYTRLIPVSGATRVRFAAGDWLAIAILTALVVVATAATVAVATAAGATRLMVWSGEPGTPWWDVPDVEASGLTLALPNHPWTAALPAAMLLVSVFSAGHLIGAAFREWSPWLAVPAIVPAVAPVPSAVAWYYAAGSDGTLWTMWGTPTWWVLAVVVIQTALAWVSQVRGRIASAS